MIALRSPCISITSGTPSFGDSTDIEGDHGANFLSHRTCRRSIGMQTAKGDSKLPEEAIHLAAGMLMVRYGSVVGTMWSIRDDDAPITRSFTDISSVNLLGTGSSSRFK